MKDLLDDHQIEKSTSRRRDLLPLWIKIFIWLFLIAAVFIPVVVVLGILGVEAELSIYGMYTNQVLSIMGIIIIALFLLKGIVAYGLWTEKEWAVNLGIIDAISGIIICLLVMLVLPIFFSSIGFHFELRLELIALGPYLHKLLRIKSEWQKRMAL